MIGIASHKFRITEVILTLILFQLSAIGVALAQGKSPVQGPQETTIVEPLPLPTFDVDTPALQPFRATGSRNNFTVGNSFGFNEIIFNPVPNSKRLAVTFASYQLVLDYDPPAIDASGSCSLGVRDPGGPGVTTRFWLPVSFVDSPSGVVGGVSVRRILAGAPVTLYAEEGELVEFSCVAQSVPDQPEANFFGSISGYFIDVA